MTPTDIQWQIKLVQERYHILDLTLEQAEQVYLYEKDKNTFSEKHHFSAWEEWDYELTTFRQILNAAQLKTYEAFLKESMRSYEQSLIESDKGYDHEIAYHKELLHFYESQFLPPFFSDPFCLRFLQLHADKEKINYLRAEYKRFLVDTKKEVLTTHFRHNRNCKPNELMSSLLRHRLSCAMPNYFQFSHNMDDPTKAVAKYLVSRFVYLPEETEALLLEKLEEARLFSETNFAKHFGGSQGWHVAYGRLTAEEEKEQRIITLLLLDKDKYGC